MPTSIMFTNAQNYSDIADAIRAKNGTSDTYKPGEMASAIMQITPAFSGTIDITENGTFSVGGYAYASVSVSGGTQVNNQDKTVTPSTEIQYVTYAKPYTGLGTVTVNAIPSAYIIPTGKSLISENGTFDVASYASVGVSVPNPPYNARWSDNANFTTFTDTSVTTIPYGTFAYTLNLTNVSFPLATVIGSYAFGYCFKLAGGSFPELTTISAYAFQYCSSFRSGAALNSTIFPKVKGTIGGYAFRGCQYLTGIDLSLVTSLGAQTFSACSRITTVNLPVLTNTAGGTFSYLTTCTSYSLPALKVVGSSTFYSNWALSTLTLPAVTTISAYAFRYCSTLMSLYLPGSSIPTLASTAFANMPMSVSVGGVYGSIYVPSTMLAAYKAATNWKTYSARMVAIPE